jgi:hypothetical protein
MSRKGALKLTTNVTDGTDNDREEKKNASTAALRAMADKKGKDARAQLLENSGAEEGDEAKRQITDSDNRQINFCRNRTANPYDYDTSPKAN